MGFRVEPADCPGCERPFEVNYGDRRHAGMPLPAKLILVVSFILSCFLVPVLFVAANSYAQDFLEDYDLFRRDKRVAAGLVSALVALVGLVPGHVGGKIALARPKRMPMTCRHCDWHGVCRLTESLDPSAQRAME